MKLNFCSTHEAARRLNLSHRHFDKILQENNLRHLTFKLGRSSKSPSFVKWGELPKWLRERRVVRRKKKKVDTKEAAGK